MIVYQCDKCNKIGPIVKLTLDKKGEEFPKKKFVFEPYYGDGIKINSAIFTEVPRKFFEKDLCEECYKETSDKLDVLIKQFVNSAPFI